MNDLDNAQRETLEEANQNIFDYDILDIETLTYEYDLYRQGVLCKKSVTGFFALKKTDSPIILSDEHISYEWVSRSRLSQLFEVELHLLVGLILFLRPELLVLFGVEFLQRI